MEQKEEIKECKIKKCLCSKTVLITLLCLICFFVGYYSGYNSARKTQSRNFNSPRVITPNRRIPRNVLNVNKPNIKNPTNKPPIKTVNTNLKIKPMPKQNVKSNIPKATKTNIPNTKTTPATKKTN